METGEKSQEQLAAEVEMLFQQAGFNLPRGSFVKLKRPLGQNPKIKWRVGEYLFFPLNNPTAKPSICLVRVPDKGSGASNHIIPLENAPLFLEENPDPNVS